MVDRGRGSIRWHRGAWELRVQVNNKRPTRRFHAPNTHAGRALAYKELDAWIRVLDANVDDLTIEGAIEMYEASKAPDWSPSTQKSHANHAAPIILGIGATPLASLKRQQVQDLYDGWRREGKAPGTIRRRHSVLRAALRHAVKHEWILVSPAEGVDLPKVPQDLMELPSHRAILNGIERIEPKHRRIQAVASLAVGSGARRGELAALRWSEVDFDNRTIVIKASIAEGKDRALVRKQTKTGSVRVVDVDDAVMADLRRWRAESSERALHMGVRIEEGFPVFGSPSDPAVPVRPSRIGQDWYRRRGEIGLAGLRFHDLRHRYATTLLELGVPVHHVSQRLGHASPTVTLTKYAHAIPSGDRAGANATAAARREIG